MRRRNVFIPDSVLRNELDRIDENVERLEILRAGCIEVFLGQSDKVPSGYHVCDGRPVSRRDNPKLFAAWGTIFGIGDGSTTFNMPSLLGQIPVGCPLNKVVGNAETATVGTGASTLTTFNYLPIVKGV